MPTLWLRCDGIKFVGEERKMNSFDAIYGMAVGHKGDVAIIEGMLPVFESAGRILALGVG